MSDVYAELMAKSVYPSAEAALAHARLKAEAVELYAAPQPAVPSKELAIIVKTATDVAVITSMPEAPPAPDLPPEFGTAIDVPAPGSGTVAFDLAPPVSAQPVGLPMLLDPPKFVLPPVAAAPSAPPSTAETVAPAVAPEAAPADPAPVYLAAPVPMYLVTAPVKAPAGPFVPVAPTELAPRPGLANSNKKKLSDLVGDYDPAEWLEPVLRDLVTAGASDVHLTLSGITKNLTVEARTDGELELVKVITGKGASVIVNKLKTMSDLSTSSSRVPGDGRYILEIDGHPYRVRAVSLPLFDGGEKLVLRLPSTGLLKTLDHIGFTETNMNAVRALLAKPGGMTLIAGPMGEGKTTTAHATIMAIGTEGKAVTAVEDPVERVLNGVSQIEVNEEVGAGFGDIMRYLVRADFDTLFIGEIRDSITAAAAVRMAKAGRRVISTIHATDNVTAMLRLIELSSDSPLSVLDAVSGVISQRLVRKLDPATGAYDGRHPIHEVLFINDDFTDRLIANKSLGEIRAAAGTTSTTFTDNLAELVRDGITDIYEARRVTGHDV
jgi:type II secretory ATPase GspE/PulE/Tfp pilus assembly ATPase PilB-like protein